jgi:hypothetical protein
MVIRSKAVDADISSLAFVNYNCSSLLFRRRGRTHYALDQVWPYRGYLVQVPVTLLAEDGDSVRFEDFGLC